MSLPEVPLLAVLPGHRRPHARWSTSATVRRDHADFFCTHRRGACAASARVDWSLVDELAPPSQAGRRGAAKTRPGVAADLGPPQRCQGHRPARRSNAAIEGDDDPLRPARGRDRPRAPHRQAARAGPDAAPPADAAAIHAQGAAFWPLALARELDDAILHLRRNETEIGTWVLQSQGDAAPVDAYDALLAKRRAANWLVREIVLYWKRTLKRLDVTLAQPDRAGRARLLLRRHAVRAGAGGRPLLHAGRPVRRLQPPAATIALDRR